MPNIMLHDDEARMALGRGVAKLAKAVRGTLGPRGMNAIIDRPIGTPIISRDGVSIANEIELEDPFENIGAQVLREVSKQTNEIAGDGTTTATVLAEPAAQEGLGSVGAAGAGVGWGGWWGVCWSGGALPVSWAAPTPSSWFRAGRSRCKR